MNKFPCAGGERWILSVVQYNVESLGQGRAPRQNIRSKAPSSQPLPTILPLNLSDLHGADSVCPYVHQLSSPYGRPLVSFVVWKGRVFSTRLSFPTPRPTLKSSSLELELRALEGDKSAPYCYEWQQLYS